MEKIKGMMKDAEKVKNARHKLHNLKMVIKEAENYLDDVMEKEIVSNIAHVKSALIEALRQVDYEVMPALKVEDVNRCLGISFIDYTGGKLYPEIKGLTN